MGMTETAKTEVCVFICILTYELAENFLTNIQGQMLKYTENQLSCKTIASFQDKSLLEMLHTPFIELPTYVANILNVFPIQKL
ncbi:hypothetical protein RchiOBHm_Chr2g0171631 [Rosa chinensis]|uniref:Uncharacterized protein n=1 Tax=Rosa chinensis TaxID=74649 RepID=A0A2P6S5D9_ROSCH|nr:hypothetical protein RchiOBHm_Chr2g0171631 [Rosa chinensis]